MDMEFDAEPKLQVRLTMAEATEDPVYRTNVTPVVVENPHPQKETPPKRGFPYQAESLDSV